MTKRPTDRDRSNKRPNHRRNGTILTISAIVIFAFGLLAMIGLFGGAVKDFFHGAFGFFGYAFFAVALVATLTRKFIRKFMGKRGAIFAFFLLLIFLLWLQILTSYKEYGALEETAYRAYLTACYAAGAGTCGGVVIGWIAYPLLALMDKYAAIVLAALFFVLLFFALFPMMREASASESKKGQTKPAPEKKKGKSHRSEKELRLFVDKVRPGQKDAQKIKFRSPFAKKGAEPLFFDVTDDRPLFAPEGMIPEERPERYDVVSASSRGEDEMEFEDDFSLPIAPRERTNGARTYDTPSTPISDIPPFIKQYKGAYEKANENAQGEEIAEPVTEERKEPRIETDFGYMPKAEVYKPKARPGNIISDMSDLKRVKQAESRSVKRTTFLGETPTEEPETPVSEAPAAPEYRAPVGSAPQAHTYSAPVPPAFSEPAAPTYRQPAPEPEPTPAPDSVLVTERAEKSFSDRTITPSEASSITPTESAWGAPARAPEPSRATYATPTAQSDEQAEEPFRTRKPRSDIGGTHRTAEAPKPFSGFIPPSKIKQPDIEEVLKEEEEAPIRPYTPPPVSLLKEFPPIQDDENVEEMGESLVQALASFNINSSIVDHKTGPTFTQFAVTLPDNMSVNKLTPLEKDIKRKLKVNQKDIRIIPSVPDLDAVGIEVPNKVCSTIGLRSIINSPVFKEKSKLMFSIGVDVSGKPVYGNLLKMPHLLVAGATGSGKSVCLNVIITSIMYHYSPEFVRFIMIDPKKVELSAYRNMPHMLIPSTITEPDKAINALSWLVDEMERRYDLLMNAGCKDIDSYNAKMERQGGKKLYYIVFIIDEMADLMYVARKDIDEKVNRIAAKARAAGINMILATQRPSVDVITGTIKANLRARIAFKVGSYIDSKTIIDKAGAEGLFGNGDMLYMPADGGELIRLQGPFISEDELDSIVTYIKAQNDCRFDYAAEKNIYAVKELPPEPAPDGEGDEDGEDEFFAPALLYFIDIGQASISKLQIKYHIGYGRAARIVETMAERGYLGPSEGGNKPRAVLLTREEYFQLYGEGDSPEEGE